MTECELDRPFITQILKRFLVRAAELWIIIIITNWMGIKAILEHSNRRSELVNAAWVIPAQ